MEDDEERVVLREQVGGATLTEFTPPDEGSTLRSGLWFAGAAYLMWGLLPIYWKLLDRVPAKEILAHRIVWSLGFVLALLVVQRRWRWLATVVRSPRVLLAFTASAALLSLNWYLYIWAVNAGFIVETSLGYFINPLVSTALGVIFLRERLRAGQTLAFALAGCAVLYLTVQYGSLPWIALALALTFGLYGLLRKTASLGSVEGLALETMIVFLPELAYLAHLATRERLAFVDADPRTMTLLILSGAATAVPLLLFASGARRMPLTLLGVLQYIAPTLQFLLGVYVYDEPMTRARLVGFALVWLAIAIFTIEGMENRRRVRKRARSGGP